MQIKVYHTFDAPRLKKCWDNIFHNENYLFISLLAGFLWELAGFMGRQVYGALNERYRNLYYTCKETLKHETAFASVGL